MPEIYVLTLFHYNLQYCAGGLEDLFDVDWPTDAASVEDQIITESFEPLLDLLVAHPTWAMDIELQAYMVEVLAARHPVILGKLQDLALSGQVELVSFHYSDQLWTAYPWRDQQVSLELTAEIFAEHGLPLSPVVFTQEGQFGEGMLERMPEYGYDIALLPRNLASHLWGASAESTLYTHDAVTVVPTRSLVTKDYAVEWAYVDDGELMATNDLNCYLGPAFVESQASVDAFEADVEARVAKGGRVVRITDYVAEVTSFGTTPLPPIVDGTWQPDDTTNLFRWMGGEGDVWPESEEDNLVLTTGMATSHEVAAARALDADAPEVDEAYRQLLLGQVSDATGWNPWWTETDYALASFAAASDLAHAVAARSCDGAASLSVDLATGEVVEPDETTGVAVAAPLAISGERQGATIWTEDADGVDRLDLEVAAGEGAASVTFPWDGAVIATTPALLDDRVVEIDAALLAADPLGLPLPIGLARLAEDRWLVLDTATVHLAGLFSRSAQTLTFRDETLDPTSTPTWTFHILEGTADQALRFATARNVSPIVTFDCPAGMEPEVGCGCATGRRSGWISWPLLALFFRRRSSAARPG